MRDRQTEAIDVSKQNKITTKKVSLLEQFEVKVG